MSLFSDPLSPVRVASPCTADWDSMIGDKQVRFCGQCALNVYNLSAMSLTQAENLIADTGRRLCIRYYRRKDGSILTQNCPVGLRALKQRISRIRRAVAAALLGFFTGATGSYAVNGFKPLGGEPHIVGQLAVHEVNDPIPMPVVGRYELGDEVLEPRFKPRKRRGRR